MLAWAGKAAGPGQARRHASKAWPAQTADRDRHGWHGWPGWPDGRGWPH